MRGGAWTLQRGVSSSNRGDREERAQGCGWKATVSPWTQVRRTMTVAHAAPTAPHAHSQLLELEQDCAGLWDL